MEPVEINAGAWYLRALRADERMDDRPVLAELTGVDDSGPLVGDYVARAAADWESDVRYSWAVCEPTTGEMLAEVTLDPASGAVGTRARLGHDDAAAAARAAVRRFAQAISTQGKP
ncbi:hypothetical protein MINS_15770 [Mycolicibacterium insubricum]|uniref:Uncharacterized protein n=1 Tax=Mycolicibacterium insubricum TaxID=444597 RepID=A0A1X0D2U3_9MYCO|nr:hypothetical protein [Mycolicibacterium insubricum]MCB9440415.1 hypothetical protein [Mycolicibacterium sp.]MCV7080766.1 hypothetical protein [Mycolicibacterium insubricum]ORA66090.1 hypothetical protein BST26_17835 [Mycolicibacterium insubricum]BBZ66148.1 hypothetical protein MINS_15770 [Mycolicibacterium insubricum]